MYGIALALAWLALMIVAGIAASRVLRLCRVQGGSMVPTLRNGDWLLARRWLLKETPQRDEIVVLDQPGFPPVLVKRIAVASGEVVPKDIPYERQVLGPGEDIVAADDHDIPVRERFLGPIRREQLWGKVCLTLSRRRRSSWPPSPHKRQVGGGWAAGPHIGRRGRENC
jgi:signal peptidase I